MKKYVSLIILSIIFFPVSAKAEIIYLKNGFTVEGTIKSRDDEKIILSTRDGEIEFFHDEIKSIEGAKKTVDTKAKKEITLYLKNGAVICGRLIEENPDEIFILWQGIKTNFSRAEIERVEDGRQVKEEDELLFPVKTEETWPYENEVAVRLTNLEVLDFDVFKAEKDKVLLRQNLEEGGFIEQEIERSKIETLLFKPVENEDSEKLQAKLEKLFPKMEFYQEGPFTIITDSHPVWVNEYKKVIRNYATSFYLNYVDLLRGQKLNLQNFIVIFDEWTDFVKFALSEGVPGWQVAGYFSPKQETLYMYNMLGEKFSDYLFEAIVKEPGMCIDAQKEQLKKLFGGEKDIVIEGMADEIKFKYERYYKNVYNYYKTMTLSTLRHELTHEFLYNYGLQNVVVSKMKNRSEADENEKKGSKDLAQSLKNLFALRQKQGPELEAANSWLVEGMATYNETYPVGMENKRWLFIFQEAERQGRVLPFEQLSVYKIGSFPGVAGDAMLYAYAQSWAFTHFLMNDYKDEFIEYQKKMSVESARDFEDVEWFAEILDKDVREVEKEFLAYMKNFPVLKDPEVNWVLLKNEIFGR